MRFEQSSSLLGLWSSVSIQHVSDGCTVGEIEQFYHFQHSECCILHSVDVWFGSRDEICLQLAK